MTEETASKAIPSLLFAAILAIRIAFLVQEDEEKK